MASPNDIRKGKVIMYQNKPHIVLESMHRTQGRQAGFVQSTLRNLDNGSSTITKFRTTDTIIFCHTESKNLEFSYVDHEGYHFMDQKSFEDHVLSTNLIIDQKKFLVPNNSYDVLFVDSVPVQLQLPTSINMLVKESPESVRGDSTSSVQKPITTETGIIIHVPLFIKAGDIIKINTNDKSYLGRV